MMDYKPEVGDIVLMDSQKLGARIVKYFMRSPTLWHDLWRKYITHKLRFVPYYHVAMIYEIGDKVTMAEQQSHVQIAEWRPNDIQIIFRKKNFYDAVYTRMCFQITAHNDLGQGYDVVNCFGKFITWLTGIKWFARYFEWPQAEICINRVARWYEVTVKEKFGALTHTELTTLKMYDYLMNSDDYEIVYTKP